KSNYNYNSYSGYYGNTGSNYTDEEKKNLKKIYKELALKFHPDVNKEGEEVMKLVNKLKEQWEV
ncbi:DnaJ domain-containing protein, partial [Stenotrophomonas maltophilia group sp. RNC7]|uniref:DnaJ domain-containing protein n=1 Tax=Stenotrophomonas maltophilia group sp. RNC7 TaxID=3071467 RepID=UPI0027DF2094